MMSWSGCVTIIASLQCEEPTNYYSEVLLCFVLLIQPNFSTFYHKLWNLKLPSKITIMVWRFDKNFLPTISNLAKRRLTRWDVSAV